MISLIALLFNSSADKASYLLFFGFTFFFFVFLHLLAVKGLKQQKRWGCPLSITLGIILLFASPFGMLVGGYILYQMLRNEWF